MPTSRWEVGGVCTKCGVYAEDEAAALVRRWQIIKDGALPKVPNGRELERAECRETRMEAEAVEKYNSIGGYIPDDKSTDDLEFDLKFEIWCRPMSTSDLLSPLRSEPQARWAPLPNSPSVAKTVEGPREVVQSQPYFAPADTILDKFGELYSLLRLPGESDESYRQRLLDYIQLGRQHL